MRSKAPGLQVKAARQMPVTQLVVKLRNPKAQELVQPLGEDRVGVLSSRAGVRLQAHRAAFGGASVLRFDRPMTADEARAIAARVAADPAVEYAEPDWPVRAYQAVPPDSSYTTRHWHYYEPATVFNQNNKPVPAVGGLNAPGAWALLKGSRKIIVAVVDTGIVTSHPELSGTLLPGYDFVSGTAGGLAVNFIANDGDGRDADANDPGDWISAADKTTYPAFCDDGNTGDSESSWHGTHMAGTIVGVWGNGVGGAAGPGTTTAGIAPNVKLLPVRGLGKCGGTATDIADGIAWAAGLAVPNVPTNPNPAHVISLSLGSQGGACSFTYGTVINAVTAAGSLVVAASGNDGAQGVSSPANCANVLAVTAHTINGDNADYANVGPEVAISAPGGGTPTQLASTILSTDNGYYTFSSVLFGATTQSSQDGSGRSGPATAGFTGTSSATAHASAVAALIKSVRRSATPAEIRNFITSTARAHPVGGYCLASGAGTCGAGLIDAGAAVAAASVNVPPLADAGPAQSVNTGAVVTLNGTGSAAFSGRTIASYAWVQTAGAAVALTGPTTAQPTFTAPATPQSFTFTLTVTDSAGQTDSVPVTVTSSTPPPPSGGGGGGGGALPWTQLLLLAAAAFASRLRRRP